MGSAFTLISGFFPVVVLAALYAWIFRRRWQGKSPGDRFSRRFAEPTGSSGVEVEKTALARLGVANLETNAGIIAKAGSGGTARQSLDEFILRPTPGVRAISLGLAPVALYLIWAEPGEFLPADGLIPWGLTALIAYAVMYLQTYELRYNRDTIIARGMAFNRREHAWKDLVRIRDNGHYLYILNFADGSKLEIQKYLVGMPDFLTFARNRISANLRGECRNFPKSKPSAAGFSLR